MIEPFIIRRADARTWSPNAPCPASSKCRHDSCRNLRRIVALKCKLCDIQADYETRLVVTKVDSKGQIESVVHVVCQIRAWETEFK